jgi:hypothetical protein
MSTIASIPTSGHRANAPGLRGHSCGSLYPYTIVARNFGKEWGVLHSTKGGCTWGFSSQRRAEQAAFIALVGG